MSRRRVVSAFVCSVFLLLITMTAHSLFSDIEDAEAESESAAEYRDVRREASYVSGAPRTRTHHAVSSDESVPSVERMAPDAGVDEVFIRELTLCIVSDCMARRSSGDAGVMVAALPPPPPKAR